MEMTLLHWTVLVVLGLTAAYFVGATFRHRRAIRAMDVFLAEYDLVCKEDTINIEVLENMISILKFSCRWCAGLTILAVFAMYKYNTRYRVAVDAKSTLRMKDLRPDAARRLLAAYEALFDYACCSLPIIGGVVRWAIRTTGDRAKKTAKPGIFIVAGRRILSPFEWSLAVA